MARFGASTQPDTELRLEKINGGVSYKYIQSQLNDNQSPYMLNMNANDKGSLTSRDGQTVYKTFSASPIHRITWYNDKFVVHAGTKLYTYDGTTETEIYSLLTSQKGSFFVMNGTLYYLNGAEYIQYNGTTVTTITGYIPTILISKPPTGGGTAHEDLNLLSAGFKESFSGNASSTTYTLSMTSLDATTTSVTVGSTALTEGTNYTVDRTAGTVNFAAGTSPHGAPASGTNNVIITAYKTQTGFANRIKNCKYVELFGGENDTRVFVSGNSNYKNQYWYCGVFDPTYFPENSYNRLGSDYHAITGFAKQYDTLVVFKERETWSVTFKLGDDGTVSYPTKPINSSIGCDMPETIQLIDNDPVFCNTYGGVHILRSSVVRDERNIKLISSNINGAPTRPGLLDETEADLLLATSADYDNKYWLCVGSKVWAWDYEQTPYSGDDELLAWFPYSNVSANCFFINDRTLYYGKRNSADMVTTQENLNDFGSAFNRLWRSKLFHFNLPDFLKSVMEIWVTTRAAMYSDVNITYYDDSGSVVDTQTLSKSDTASFSWANFAWDALTWAVYTYAPTFKKKPKLKKVQYFQIEFSNSNLNENLSILSLVIRYVINRKIK